MLIRTLFINVFDSLQGDVNGFLGAYLNLDPSRFEAHALSNPRGATYQKLKQSGSVRIHMEELGGESGNASGSRLQNAWAFQKGLLVACQLILRHKIDLVYTVDRTRASLISLLAARMTGRPLVVSSNAYYFGDSRLYRPVLRSATYIHTCSEALGRQIRQYVPDPSRIVPIHYGIPLSRYDLTLSPRKARELLDIPPSANLILLPGRMVAYKGQGDLLVAASEILKKFPDTYFVFCGPDSSDFVPSAQEHARSSYPLPDKAGISFCQFLRDKATEIGITDRVRIRGSWPWDDMPSLLSAADIVCMPSWGEPFGLVALEGMAMGKPVIATRVSGIPEFVPDGKVGALVLPQDPPALARNIISLLEQKVMARDMGRAGRLHVEQNYSLARYLRDIEALLVQAVRCKTINGGNLTIRNEQFGSRAPGR